MRKRLLADQVASRKTTLDEEIDGFVDDERWAAVALFNCFFEGLKGERVVIDAAVGESGARCANACCDASEVLPNGFVVFWENRCIH